LKTALITLALLSAVTTATHAARFDQEIPMRITKASTFYVDGYVAGLGAVDMMVDTGSSYTTINEEALAVLQQKGAATYVRDLTGIMADGTRKVVPIYRIASMSIGGGCALHDVEAAVFPGKTRYILGLSALKMAAPFAFSLEPPTLVLSNCAAAAAASPAVASPAGAKADNDVTLNAELAAAHKGPVPQ
jgi:predicted aspartyl protease